MDGQTDTDLNPHMETCRHTKNFNSNLKIRELDVDRYMHPPTTGIYIINDNRTNIPIIFQGNRKSYRIELTKLFMYNNIIYMQKIKTSHIA